MIRHRSKIKFLRKKPKSLFAIAMALSFVFTALILYINIYLLESTLNNFKIQSTPDYSNMESDYWLHVSHPVFALRPLTSWLIDVITKFGVAIPNAYLSIFAILLVCNGLLVFRVGRLLKLSASQVVLSIVLFYFSFNIIFIFAGFMHSYDEPVQYALLLLALNFIVQKKYLPFSLMLLLSVVARETSLFLLPAFMLIGRRLGHSWKQIVGAIGVVVFCYVIFYFAYGSYVGQFQRNVTYFRSERFMEWKYSFQNMQFAKESVIMAFITTFPSFFLVYEYVRSKKLLLYRTYVWAFTISVIINTPLCFVTARAQESRIFALPMIFLWPISGLLFEGIFARFRQNKWRNTYICMITMFVFILPLSYLAFYFYDPTTNGNARLAFQIYFFVIILLVSAFKIYKICFDNNDA